MYFFISHKIFRCCHHSSDPHISPSLEISLPVVTVASIAHFDHMASFGHLTFHLLAHEFVATLHLAILGFSLACHLPSMLIPLLVHHFVKHSHFCVSLTSVDRYTVHKSIQHPWVGQLPFASDFDTGFTFERTFLELRSIS